MSKPVVAGAFPLARLAMGLLLPIACCLVPLSAHSEDAGGFRCGPASGANEMARATGGEPFITLSGEQFQFVRGLFVMAPDTPSSLPPGDRAAMSMRADGSASIVFVDGDQACAPMKLGKEGVDLLMQVGRGEIVHVGSGL
jgi:hypothetical protein